MLKEDFKEITDRAFEMDEKIENIVVDFEGEIINDEYLDSLSDNEEERIKNSENKKEEQR